MLEAGAPAPEFELEADDGSRVRLSELRGNPVVLFFYPKDDTPGCTKQACGFRDAYREFQDRGAHVFGISRDDGDSHRRFKEKYGLPFRLLSDPDHAVSELYGVWGERSFAGKKYMGIKRSTFVIDADGRILDAGYGVKPDSDPGRVLEVLPS
jgi:thioredoxin-dependent peroxiredoxin